MDSGEGIFLNYLRSLELGKPESVLRDILSNFITIPSPIILRKFYFDLYNLLQSDDFYQESSTHFLIDSIRDILLHTGMVKLDLNDELFLQPLVNKYATYEEICNMPKTGIRVLNTGAFDPLHAGHFQAFKTFAEGSDELIIGFDSNQYLAERKGRNNDPRPRYPELGWRMIEATASPYVKLVYVIPNQIRTDTDFSDMYRKVNPDRIGTGKGNSFLKSYQNSIRALGGDVVENPEAPITSTLIHQIHSHPQISSGPLVSGLRTHINEMECLAREMGYLADQVDYIYSV